MWTSNSGDPFNQPSKSCTKWLLVMYKPGGGGGGGGGDPPPPLPPPSPQSIRHCSRAGRARWGGAEKAVFTRTKAGTGGHGGILGSSTWPRPPGSEGAGGGRGGP